MSRLPVAALIISMMSVALQAFPEAAAWCVFDRQAVLHGQIWRLLTSPLVHFSVSHLVLNILVFLGATVCSGLRNRDILLVFFAVALLSAFAVLWLAPEMVRFGGLSGIATAMVACAVWRVTQCGGFAAVSALGVLAALSGKIAFEGLTGQTLFAELGPGIKPAPLAHAAGLLVAGAFWATHRPCAK